MPRGLRAQQVGWWTGHAPPTTGPTGTATTWVGVLLKFTVPGRVFGLQFWDGTGAVTTDLWTMGVLCSDQIAFPDKAKATVLAMSANQSPHWQHMWFGKPHRVVVGDTYRLAILYIAGGFYRTNSALISAVTRNGVQFLSSWQSTSLDVAWAPLTTNTNANAVDVLFQAD